MLASLVKGLWSNPHSPGRKPYLSRVKWVTPGISLGGVRREVSFVLPRHLGRVEIGVGPQHPLAVVASVLGDLRLIDPKVIGTTTTQVTTVALVTDQRLVPAAELLPQRRHDRLPVGGIRAGFLLVETDHVTTLPHPDLLDLQGGGIVA